VTALEIIILVIVVLVAVLIVGGYVITGRRQRADDAAASTELEAANEALALARASDKGWERSLLETAVRAAFAERSEAEIRDLQLVQVVDKPGTEDDQAVYEARAGEQRQRVVLGRRDGDWTA